MKILVVCQYYYPEPFRVTDICEELVKRGNQVTVLTGLPNYPEGKILKEYKKKEHRDEIRNGVRVIRCNEHGRGHNAINMLWNYFSFAISGMRKIKKLDKDFDIVFINQLSPVMMAWPGIKYAKRYNKKIVLYCYDLWPASLAAGGIRKESIIYKIFKNISKKIYEKVDEICITSHKFVDYFREEHQINENKLSYLPQYCEDIYNKIESQFKKNEMNYVFAGNIGKMQSIETIIRAAEIIKDNKAIKIHIVGDGRDLSNCIAIAKEKGLDNIIFYGRKSIEEMPKFYSMANAMLVTLAKDELVSNTLPGKVQSYMAAGKAIIASADGETSFVIKESNSGLVCSAEDSNGLAKIMVDFMNYDCSIFECNARNYSNANFRKDNFFSNLENELKAVIKK